MAEIAVVDYGAGNLTSVSKALELVGARVSVTAEPGVIKNADGIVLPGVGAFGDAVNRLWELGIIPVMEEKVKNRTPFLGICLGFQLLFTESEEKGRYLGFNWLQGRVKRFRHDLKVPHVGWNQVDISKANPLLEGIPDHTFFYFVHSYYVEPEEGGIISARTQYGKNFVSMIHRDNIFGVQFHPEKSGDIGQVVLKNFFRCITSGGEIC
jgi:glutamine amidotransferase